MGSGNEVTTWTLYGPIPKDKRQIHVWATTEAEVDLALHDQILVHLREIFGRDEHYRKELKKIEGIQMRLELWIPGDDFDQRFLQEVMEITDKEPGPHVYGIPEGFTQEEHIVSEDF